MTASGRAQDESNMTSEDRNALLGGLQDTLDVNLSLVARDPDNSEWQHDLAVTYDRIGTLRWTGGDLEGALRSFEESVTIGKELIERNDKNTAWLKELSYAAGSVGTLLIDLGKLQAALEPFELERSMVRRLIANEPDNTEFQRELTATLERIVEIRLAGRDYGLVHPVLEQRLRACSDLAARDPDHEEWQSDLALAHHQEGLLLAYQWQAERAPPSAMEMALSAFRQGLEIREELVDKDPENAEWRHDLSTSQIMTGHVHIDLGQPDDALPYLEACREIREELVRLNPAKDDRQAALANAHHAIGECRAKLGDLNAALDAFLASGIILEHLVERSPDNDHRKEALLRCQDEIADLCHEKRDPQGAFNSLSKRSSVIEDLLAKDPASPRWQREKISAQRKMAALQFSMGDIKRGVDRLRESLTTSARLIEQRAGSDDLHADMLANLKAAVSWLSKHAHWSQVIALLEHAEAIVEQLAEARPDDPAFQNALADIGHRLDDTREAKARATRDTIHSAFSAFADGHRLEMQGDLGGALSAFEKGLQIARRCAEDPSDYHRCQQLLITNQTLCGDIASRNSEPDRAQRFFMDAAAIAATLDENDRLPRDLVRTVDGLRSRLRGLDAASPGTERTEGEKSWWRRRLSRVRNGWRSQRETG